MQRILKIKSFIIVLFAILLLQITQVYAQDDSLPTNPSQPPDIENPSDNGDNSGDIPISQPSTPTLLDQRRELGEELYRLQCEPNLQLLADLEFLLAYFRSPRFLISFYISIYSLAISRKVLMK